MPAWGPDGVGRRMDVDAVGADSSEGEGAVVIVEQEEGRRVSRRCWGEDVSSRVAPLPVTSYPRPSLSGGMLARLSLALIDEWTLIHSPVPLTRCFLVSTFFSIDLVSSSSSLPSPLLVHFVPFNRGFFVLISVGTRPGSSLNPLHIDPDSDVDLDLNPRPRETSSSSSRPPLLNPPPPFVFSRPNPPRPPLKRPPQREYGQPWSYRRSQEALAKQVQSRDSELTDWPTSNDKKGPKRMRLDPSAKLSGSLNAGHDWDDVKVHLGASQSSS